MEPNATEGTLETARLVLEPLVVGHAAAVYNRLGDERLYAFVPQDPPASLAAVERRYGQLADRRSPDGREGWLNWLARRRGTDEYVGTFEATVHPDGAPELAMIAYMVFVPDQRRGYATEGCRRVLEHLFADHAVATVAAEIDTRNRASIALVERLGFARVATHQAVDFFKGAPSDEYRYELRAADFADDGGA